MSASALASTQARRDLPTRRDISIVRPPSRPRTDSLSPRVFVARGSIAYAAVTQPSPLPRHRQVSVGCTVGRAGLDPPVDPPHAVGQADGGLPAQVALGPLRGQGTALQLAGPCGRELRVDRAAGRLADQPGQVEDAGLDPGPEVPDAGPALVGGGEEGRDRVAHVDIVAGLRPVAVDDGPLPREPPGAEDRDAGGPARRAPRPAGPPGQPQDRVPGAGQPAVQAD